MVKDTGDCCVLLGGRGILLANWRGYCYFILFLQSIFVAVLTCPLFALFKFFLQCCCVVESMLSYRLVLLIFQSLALKALRCMH